MNLTTVGRDAAWAGGITTSTAALLILLYHPPGSVVSDVTRHAARTQLMLVTPLLLWHFAFMPAGSLLAVLGVASASGLAARSVRVLKAAVDFIDEERCRTPCDRSIHLPRGLVAPSVGQCASTNARPFYDRRSPSTCTTIMRRPHPSIRTQVTGR